MSFTDRQCRTARQVTYLAILSCLSVTGTCNANDGINLVDPVDAARPLAEKIVQATATTGGLVVHLGCRDGALTAALAINDRFLVHGLDRNSDNVAAARKMIAARGRYGAVAVDQLTGPRLPYADDLARLVVASQGTTVPLGEILRVVCPGGAVYAETGTGKWQLTRKPWPKTIDQWTHYLHDASGNAVAADQQVGPPRAVRWIAGPTWGRSHEFNPTMNALVSAAGRLFYIYDEGLVGLPDLRLPARWSLIARDAFSGKLLWKRPVPNWGWREWNTRGMWSAPLTLNRRLVTDGTRLYATLGYVAPVTVIDVATGKTIQTLEGTRGTDEMVLFDGVLYLCVRKHLSIATKAPNPNSKKRRINPHEWSIDGPGPASLVAIDTADGHIMWKTKPSEMAVLTMAAAADGICFYSGDRIVCLDRATGNQRWATPCRPKRGSRHAVGTLVMHDDVVLFNGGDGLVALSMRDGKKLWTGPKTGGPGVSQPPDLFVADGLVWSGDPVGTNRREQTAVIRAGYDLHTGQTKRTIEVPQLMSPLHHVRCYRSKATDRFLLLPKRGIEFLDLKDGQHMRNDWLRAMCHYGAMPCNGLLYVPPSYCFCYPGVRMNGFLALASKDSTRVPTIESGQADTEKRLERGPAFAEPAGTSDPRSANPHWPTYRHDALRSGHCDQTVSTDIRLAWRVKLGKKVTQPIVVGARLFVAVPEEHRVDCLDAKDGQPLWSFIAGGRVDSPPTAWRNRILFGCHDGWVYCLAANTGKLAWRFRAAPHDRRIVVRDQIESPWPVPGSVLLLDDTAYVAAGRSSFLDGGVYLYGLAPETGAVRCQQQVTGPWPDAQEDVGRPFDMDGVKSDILVTDGSHIFLMQMAFDKQLRDVTPQRTSNLGDRVMGRHLVATNGFLDDSWFDRIYWMYGNRWPGFYFANNAPKVGQIVVFDDTTTIGIHVNTMRLRLSPTFVPGSKGYQLVADANDNEPVLAPNAVNREKGAGYSRQQPPLWTKLIPVRAYAMVLTGERLFLAGPPDVLPEDDPYAAFDGRLGAKLWAVAAATGTKQREWQLDTLPAFDGLVAAAQRLYLADRNGQLSCFAPTAP